MAAFLSGPTFFPPAKEQPGGIKGLVITRLFKVYLRISTQTTSLSSDQKLLETTSTNLLSANMRFSFIVAALLASVAVAAPTNQTDSGEWTLVSSKVEKITDTDRNEHRRSLSARETTCWKSGPWMLVTAMNAAINMFCRSR
jgi:hypothetical protein